MKLKIVMGIAFLLLASYLGINNIYVFGIPTILIISCWCVTGLFYTGIEDILVNDESEGCTLGIINIFLAFILLSMTITNNIRL